MLLLLSEEYGGPLKPCIPSIDEKALVVIGRNPDTASLDPNCINELVMIGTSSKIVRKPAELASPLVASLGGSVILSKLSNNSWDSRLHVHTSEIAILAFSQQNCARLWPERKRVYTPVFPCICMQGFTRTRSCSCEALARKVVKLCRDGCID